ncbi:MAG: YhbY family RNA-binding protein [Oscillospiraceae bacterium]|jgi:RNA-binding protein|nr:YhbY family RNA-binding protein [Oscillospiraceae bacterium]
MTSAERAAFRKAGNSIPALFQIGRNGVTQAVAEELDKAFNTRELVKLKVLLDLCPEAPKTIAPRLAALTRSEVIGVVGGSILFYRYNPQLHEKPAQPKKLPVKPATPKTQPMKPASPRTLPYKPGHTAPSHLTGRGKRT